MSKLYSSTTSPVSEVVVVVAGTSMESFNVVVVGFASSVTSLLEEQAINTNASIRMLIFFILLY